MDIDDTSVDVRGLSRVEVMALSRLAGDPDEAEVYLLCKGTNTNENEVRDWRALTASSVVDLVVDKILELSGLAPGASKSGGESDSAG